MLKQLFLLLLVFLWMGCTSTYYLVRHAERANNSSDSPLSNAGHQRAQALRDTLLNKSIDSIFATVYLRTQQTANPLAQALGEPISIYHPDTTTQFVNALLALRSKNVLVVGHSNTVPEMVLQMTGDTVQIGHEDFDDLFVVSISKSLFGTRRKLKKMHYGPQD